MHLSEWQAKPVINLSDGKKLGIICDLDIDPRTGRVLSILVAPEDRWWSRWRAGEEMWIGWPYVVRIGADVILIRMEDAGRKVLPEPAD